MQYVWGERVDDQTLESVRPHTYAYMNCFVSA